MTSRKSSGSIVSDHPRGGGLPQAHEPEPIEWDETTITAAAGPEEAPVEEEASMLTAH
jgi:hypothetical protein